MRTPPVRRLPQDLPRLPARRPVTWEEAVQLALPSGAVVRSTAHLHLAPEPHNVSVARRFVREAAPGLRPDTRDTLLLLTSELVTNAVVHARTDLELAVTLTDEDVLVTVHDLDLGRREQRTHERDGGRGLGMVRTLARASGQTPHRDGGKTSWFLLCRDGVLA